MHVVAMWPNLMHLKHWFGCWLYGFVGYLPRKPRDTRGGKNFPSQRIFRVVVGMSSCLGGDQRNMRVVLRMLGWAEVISSSVRWVGTLKRMAWVTDGREPNWWNLTGVFSKVVIFARVSRACSVSGVMMVCPRCDLRRLTWSFG